MTQSQGQPPRNLGTLRFRGADGFHSATVPWILDASDATVAGLRVDHAFSIEVAVGTASYVLRIEEDFDLAFDGAAAERFTPGDAPATEFGPALALLHRAVIELVAHPDGRLTASFDGATLAVAAGLHDEAWQMHGPNDFLIVSIPGGGLSVWSDALRD